MLKLTKKELLQSEKRNTKTIKTKKYNEILLVPNGRKHSSGFMRIAVIGTTYQKNKKPSYEICGYPDDLRCLFPLKTVEEDTFPLVRIDCFYPQGVLRYHGDGTFKVSHPSDTIEITFLPRRK